MTAPAPHAKVKHELLVRHLDAWTPASLHHHGGAVFVCWAAAGAARTALRVFAEFTDLLERHPLTMVVPDTVTPAELPEVAGVTVHSGRPPHHRGHVFGWFDPSEPAALSTVEHAGSAEILLAAPTAEAPPLPATLPLHCRVELVDEAGRGELIIFATAAERALERFKEELWALDEYAGVRLRDPADTDGALSDIAAVAHLGPLRRILGRVVRDRPGVTVAELRSHALHETMFRAADAVRAVQALLTAGTVRREPPTGRVTPDTRIYPL